MHAHDASCAQERSASPVRPTAVVTGDRCRFTGIARDALGIIRLTIILRGATTDLLRIPHEVGPDVPASWDLSLAIKPGITEAEIVAEDEAGNLSVLRRLLIARHEERGMAHGRLADATPMAGARDGRDATTPPNADRGPAASTPTVDDQGPRRRG